MKSWKTKVACFNDRNYKTQSFLVLGAQCLISSSKILGSISVIPNFNEFPSSTARLWTGDYFLHRDGVNIYPLLQFLPILEYTSQPRGYVRNICSKVTACGATKYGNRQAYRKARKYDGDSNRPVFHFIASRAARTVV